MDALRMLLNEALNYAVRADIMTDSEADEIDRIFVLGTKREDLSQ